MILEAIQRKSLSIVYNEEINKAPYFNFSESPCFIGVHSGVTGGVGWWPQIYSISAMNIKYDMVNPEQKYELEVAEYYKVHANEPENITYYPSLIIAGNYCIKDKEKNLILYGADGILSNFSSIAFQLNQCVS